MYTKRAHLSSTRSRRRIVVSCLLICAPPECPNQILRRKTPSRICNAEMQAGRKQAEFRGSSSSFPSWAVVFMKSTRQLRDHDGMLSSSRFDVEMPALVQPST